VKTRNLFISHSWTYGDAYTRLCGLLDDDRYFSYRDYSVPKDDPIHNAPNSMALYFAIQSQMRPCHVVLVLAGVYASYSKWIQLEIQLANSLRKPVVAIRPWANKRVSTVVAENAHRLVGWNTSSIVGAIRELSP
jgi:hypothetical protein